MDQARHSLLADAALAGDQHGRVDLADAPRQLDDPAHRLARDDHPGRVDLLRGASAELLAAGAELAFDLAQLAGQPPGRLPQAVLRVVGQLPGDLVAPFLARAGNDTADGVPLAAAAGLERIDLAPPDTGEIAAGEAGERPADRV